MQGGHFSLFAGAAIAIQIRGSDQVSVVSFGDGAATIGGLHESLNFAAVWKLPVIYLCANNTCSETERLEMIWAQPDIAKMAIPYGIPYEIIEDNDAVALAEASARAIERARAGDGPTFLELKTFRMRAHMEKDPWDFPDRTLDEIEEWRGKDAIQMMADALVARGTLGQDQIRQIDRDAADELAAARKFADESPAPDDAEAFTEIYGSLSYDQVS
jgi:pyruvate dehydrogenase E1 component alpha subunit